MPNFPCAVERCLKNEEMTPYCTKKLVEFIGDKMYGICRYPTREDYQTISKKLVDTYPFLKDNIGSGYVSIHLI